MLQMPNVMPDQADTYKCFAINEYGQAVVTVVLNVIEGEQSIKDVDYIIRPNCISRLALYKGSLLGFF